MKSRIYIVEHWNSDVKSIENNENDSKVSKKTVLELEYRQCRLMNEKLVSL